MQLKELFDEEMDTGEFMKERETSGSPSREEIPENKQTTLGLYVNAVQAYEMWKSDPDRIKIIDVRTPEEYGFIGHPDTAWNIPLAFVTYTRKNGITEYGPMWNTEFIDEIKNIAGKDDPLLVMCRSGDRSAMAVNKLAAAGYNNAYTITDGFEGDKVDDPGSVFHGKRMRNGWKNSAPWIYTIDPEKIILREHIEADRVMKNCTVKQVVQYTGNNAIHQSCPNGGTHDVQA